MIDLLLAVWVALLSVSRVDLLGGAAPFLLSPYLVFTPVVIVLGIGSTLAHGGRVRLPRGLDRFVLLVTGLLGVVVASTFLSFDLESSANRAVLLFVQVTGVVLCGLLLANRPDPHRVLLAGARAGLVVSLAFCGLQIADWFLGGLVPGGAAAFVSLEPGDYAGVIPRLTGASHDPNLGGVVMVCYLFLYMALSPPSRGRSVLVALTVLALLLTLSRSAILAGLVVYWVVGLRASGLRIRQRTALTAAAAVGLAAATLLVFPRTLDPLEAAWDVVGTRFSLAEGSTREHAAVLDRGWEVATYDLKRLMLGVGYGNAWTTLQDIYPGNRYGNFHSLFLTLFAESGAVAALLGLALFLYPLWKGGAYQPVIAGLFVYNFFQQSQTDPLTWLLLMLAWMGTGLVRQGGDRRAGPGEATRHDHISGGAGAAATR